MDYRISLIDIDLLQTLGKGAYGRVRLGFMKTTGQYVAVKIIKKSAILQQKEVEHLISEFSILRRIHHPFIVDFKGFNQDPRYLYLILEYVPGGDLFRYLRTIGKLENSHACVYVAQMILALQYLHQNNIVYRDLKPENILIGADGFLKLTDFGFAKVIEARTYTLCGTPEYLAPEIILNKGHDQSVDWWTIGVLIFEMLAGIDPFNTNDPSKIYKRILSGKIRFPQNFNPRAKNLVKHLVIHDTSKRYKLNDIKNHAWFEEIDWNRLLRKDLLMPYVPVPRDPTENSNIGFYPDSLTLAPEIAPESDPFIDW